MELRPLVVDGGTGFVGANFVHTMLRSGRRVTMLVRCDPAAARRAVVSAVVGAVEPGPLDASELTVVAFDLGREDLGLDAGASAAVFDEPCDYWHIAASLKFLPGSARELVDVNVEGTRNTLAKFIDAAPAGSRYFHVSSAYVCGLTDRPVAEDWFEPAAPSAFRNYYEYSKRLSELVVRPYLDRGEIAGAVVRLGSIVGDSRSLQTSNTYGLYDFVERLFRISRRWPTSTVRVLGQRDAALNYVPVDVCANWMRDLADGGVTDLATPVVHLVDAPAVPVQQTFDVIAEHLPLQLQLAEVDTPARSPLTQLESLLRAGMSFTGSYLEHPAAFMRQNLEAVLGPQAPAAGIDLLDGLIGWFVADIAASADARGSRKPHRRETPQWTEQASSRP